jgi:hypothetical protein
MADLKQIVATTIPMTTGFATGGVVSAPEPMPVRLNPVHDVGWSWIRFDPAAFTPLVNFDLFDLKFHIVGHEIISRQFVFAKN